MVEKILTLHPDPEKKGVNIDKQKYDVFRDGIIEELEKHCVMSFRELMSALESKLKGSFQGSIAWYYTTVKLDLEARGIIERIPDSSPQKLRLKLS